MSDDVRQLLLDQVPDEPLNVDLRGILLDKDVEIEPGAADAPGYAVYVPAIDLACLWGEPEDAVLDALGERLARGTQVVCDEALRERVAARIEAAHAEPIHFYALPADADPVLPEPDQDVELWIVGPKEEAALDHLPGELREEMNAALDRTFVAMTYVDEEAVSFCYPHHETEKYWDVSVDTLSAYRRQGFAAMAFGAAHAVLSEHDKEPVWGALESNAASNGMAMKLGMERIGSRYVLIAGGSSGRS